MMRLFELWLADIRAKREYEELYNDARDDAAHWRGECRRLADKIRFIGIGDDSVFAELRELIPEAERILKELDKR